MNKYIYLIICFSIFSCNSFSKKAQYEFLYEFENEDKIENRDFSKTISVLKKRLDVLGYDYLVKRDAQKDIKILIKANNLNVDRFDKLMTNQGKLEFWELYKGDEFLKIIFEFSSSLVDKNEVVSDSVQANPLLGLIAGRGYAGGPIVFQVKSQDTATVSSFLNQKEVKFYVPSEYSNVKFLWGVPDNDLIPLYAAKSNRENKAPLKGESLISAIQSVGYVGRPEINIEMDNDGAITWERMTEKAFRNNTSIAITINNLVYSAPGVVSGPIQGGKSSISGNFTLEEAQDLAVILSSKIPIPKLKLIAHDVIK